MSRTVVRTLCVLLVLGCLSGLAAIVDVRNEDSPGSASSDASADSRETTPPATDEAPVPPDPTVAPPESLAAPWETSEPPKRQVNVVDVNPPAISLFQNSVEFVPNLSCFDVSVDNLMVGVSCDDAHRYQFYAHRVIGPEVTLFAEVGSAADSLCSDAFTPFVGRPYGTSMFIYAYYTPLETSWPEFRDVNCFVYVNNEAAWTGSASGSDQ